MINITFILKDANNGRYSIVCNLGSGRLPRISLIKRKAYDTNYSLEQIEKLIDPKQFFRISRKHIVNINAIVDIISYSSSRLKLKIVNSKDDDILVNRSKLTEFKKWLEK
jgi:two-component system response regulator LytT